MRRTPLPIRLLTVLAASSALALGGCAQGTDEVAAPTTPASPTPEDGPGDEQGGVAVSGGAACIAAVTYRDTLYIQVNAKPVEQGEPLQGAEVPPCDDTGGTGDEQETGTPVDAFAVRGVEPAYAVMSTSPGGQFVYVADEYVPGRVDAKPLPEDVAAALGLE